MSSMLLVGLLVARKLKKVSNLKFETKKQNKKFNVLALSIYILKKLFKGFHFPLSNLNKELENSKVLAFPFCVKSF